MATLYELTRDEIKTQLEAVDGIGKVFTWNRWTENWDGLLDRFVDSNNRVNLCWFDRESANEAAEGVGSRDERNLMQFSQRDEIWRITVIRGFSDDEDDPSAHSFQILLDKIQDKFRFLQNLNAVTFKSYPVESFNVLLLKFAASTVLAHHAELRLRVTHRIENPNPDA